MDVWISIWKYVFFTSDTVFAFMSVWVVTFGGRDVIRMLRDLRSENKQ